MGPPSLFCFKHLLFLFLYLLICYFRYFCYICGAPPLVRLEELLFLLLSLASFATFAKYFPYFLCLSSRIVIFAFVACFICYFRLICFFRQYLTNALCCFCTNEHFWTYLAILRGKSNNMAAMQSKCVPLIRGYRDSLTTENRKVYDQKLEFLRFACPRLKRTGLERRNSTSLFHSVPFH